MYSKWIKSGFVLAMLLISMVSLSMAACPWLIKNELYTAQCGVEKVVPASAGLLANDPGATAVLNPDDITIEAKYGTLDVKADGSFVFDPSPDIVSGTYVQFKYNATNGACAATVPGLGKIQVSCKCRPQVANVILCLPTTLDEIRQKLIAAGVGCLGCGATPTTIDLSKVKLEPGTYSFSIKCSGCQAALGSVTLVPACTAVAPNLEFCGPVPLAQVLAGITTAADCAGTGCDQAPVIDATGLTVVGGFVPGGSYTYTATCGAGTDCADTATGTIIVFQRCTVVAPPVTICEGRTLAQLAEAIEAAGPDCTGVGCDATPVVSFANVTVVGGLVTGGGYTVTCTVAPNCASSADGAITVVPKCVVDLLGVTLECGTPEEIEAQIKGANPSPCGDCDSTPVFLFPVWPLRADGSGNVANGVYHYIVTCNAGGLEGCDSSAIGEVAVDCLLPCPCAATAKDVTVCAGLVKSEDLEDDYLSGNVSCTSTIGTICDVTAEIDTSGVTEDTNGFVTGGTYRAICQSTADDCLPVEATGTITTKDCNVCTCEANAPDICVPFNCTTKDGVVTCKQYTLDEIKDEILANDGGCGTDDCTMTLKFYNRYGVEIPSFADLYWNAPRHYKYEVICTKGTCVNKAMGELNVLSKVECSCTTCCN
jgi:hypothetical protein